MQSIATNVEGRA